MWLRTPRQRPHRDGDRVPRPSLLMAEMKWWQSRNSPGRGGRVHGLLRPSWSKSNRTDRRGVIGKLVILAFESVGLDGNPDNIHGRYNRESHPHRLTRAPERNG